MDKKNNKENNLFKWATKELSQDAVIAWLLANNCSGKKLLKDLCPKSLGNKKFEIDDIRTQYKSIDVFVKLKVEEENWAVIIEDKTDTYLHDNQMLKYIEKVFKEKFYDKIIFLMLKTGAIPSFQQDDYTHWQEEINENKKRDFTKKDLNDTLDINDTPDNNLIISGNYQSDNIEFTSSDNKPEVYIENIYDAKKFNEFINKMNFTDEKNNAIFSHFKDSICSEAQEDDVLNILNNNFKIAYDFAKNHNIKLRMIQPGGGGKREYEYTFFSGKLYNYAADGKEIDNYLILPYIKKVKENYQFSINYNLIGDIKKVHGYVPYGKLNQNIKGKYVKLRKNIENIANEIVKKEKSNIVINTTKSKEKNRLQLLKFNAEFNEKNIELLLKVATEISEKIKNPMQ